MHSFLLKEIRDVAKILEATRNAVTPEESAIYPVLVILAKLQPSHQLDDTEDCYDVSSLFIFV